MSDRSCCRVFKFVAQSDLETAEEFIGQFRDVFNKNYHTQVPLLDRSDSSMDDRGVVSKDVVTKFLKGLNPFKDFWGRMSFILE